MIEYKLVKILQTFQSGVIACWKLFQLYILSTKFLQYLKKKKQGDASYFNYIFSCV